MLGHLADLPNALVSSLAAASPMLLVVAEDSGQELPALEQIARVVPALWAVLAVVAGSATLQRRGDSASTSGCFRSARLNSINSRRMSIPTHPPPSRARPPARLYAQESRKVLVVVDNVVNQLVARGQLEALGYDVAVAGDGIEALDSCCDAPPDMVLMDVDMPVMDGLEASEHLRAMQRVGTLPPFPIVAATSGDTAVRRDACLRAGMDGYLSKPMDLQTLADELHRVLPARPSGLDDLG